MSHEDLEKLLMMFQDSAGFGDPEARRNAELRLQVMLATEQRKTSARLNILTGCLVLVGILNALVLSFQVFG